VERTAKGVKVVETSPNAFSAKLIQAHAQVVSLFLANGPTEMRKNHAVPK
jgi:predicted nuclease with RNAse H fold